MSLDEHQGTAWAWRELFKIGAQAVSDGEIKPARILSKRADPRKVSIGRFAAKVLRRKVS